MNILKANMHQVFCRKPSGLKSQKLMYNFIEKKKLF